ncbi:MAG: protein kinase [Gemmatimonadaceae bacterium]|nr:protein kinase [Gemmatimonadaceae bacterium]
MTDLRTQLQTTLGDGYTLERELGGGGMSRVFVARENALGREVVVKVLSPDLAASVSAERFTREIATAARLQQANIVPVLSAGTSGGVSYYTMPFVKGESLRAQLARGVNLSVHDRFNVLRDVARALAYAHGEGVIHRDIKPDNILLSAGTAVVTDFGIAKAISASRTLDGTAPRDDNGTLTQVGSSIGTPAYMAPEQAVGESVDARADLYAWGVVAYELLSGAHPFAGKTGTSQLIAAHLTETPRGLAELAPNVPREVSALVMQCLAKNPAQRPADANALLSGLSSITTPSTERTASSAPARARAPWLKVAIPVVALAAFGAVLWATRRSAATTEASNALVADTTALSSIAVLPFVNTSGDSKDEYFSDGLTDELSHALSKLPGLRLAGRSSSFSFKGKSILAPDVGKALGVGAIVEGTVRRAGDRIRLTAQLTSTRNGQLLWSDAFERSGADVFAIQDAFTSAIVSALTPRLSGASPATAVNASAVGTSARGTADAQAYDLYLRGRYFWAQRGAAPGDSSIKYLEASVQRDSTFARGWAGLALAHVIRPNYNAAIDFDDASARGEAAARRALALDSTLADAYVALGFIHLRRLNFADADAALSTARRLEPLNAIAAHWSALYFTAVGDTAQADRLIEVALTLDPLSPSTFNTQAIIRFERRQFAGARESYARISAISQSSPFNSTNTFTWSGMPDSAARVGKLFLQTGAIRGRFGQTLVAEAAAGHWAEARALRTRIAANGPDITPYDRAMSDVVFGSRAAAAAEFVEHIEHVGGLANIIMSMCHPPLDAIRAEPAWKAFLARHQLKDCTLSSPWPVGPVPAAFRN